MTVIAAAGSQNFILCLFSIHWNFGKHEIALYEYVQDRQYIGAKCSYGFEWCHAIMLLAVSFSHCHG